MGIVTPLTVHLEVEVAALIEDLRLTFGASDATETIAICVALARGVVRDAERKGIPIQILPKL